MSDETRDSGVARLSYRTIAGLVLASIVLLFVVLNRDETKISFIVFDARTDLWIALLIAALGGFVVGFLMSRARYRR